MSEAKILTPHDLGGLGSGFVLVSENSQKPHYPSLGICNADTISSELLKATLKARVSKSGLKMQTVQKHSRISRHLKHRAYLKSVSSCSYIALPSGFQNIVVETPHALNESSNYRKCKITAFGLASPSKPLQADTIEELRELFSGLNIVSVDVAIDFRHPLDFSLLQSYGRIDLGVKGNPSSTHYLNRPKGLAYIERVIYYNKSHKDGLGYPLWRLEFRCLTAGKLGSLFIPIDEVQMILDALQIDTKQNRR